MAQSDQAQADKGLSPEERLDFCLHAGARRLTRDQTCCAPETFASLRAIYTQGGTVADLVAQEQP